jgi:hypothetical protein
VDDVTMMRPRCHGANGVAGAGQIDVALIMPVRVFPFQDRLERLDAGIGEQDVEPAKCSAPLFRRGPQSGEIALVEARFAPARPGGFDQTARLRQFVWRRGYDLKRRADRCRNIYAHHIGAFAGKGDRRRAPDSAGGAGDNGCLVPRPEPAVPCSFAPVMTFSPSPRAGRRQEMAFQQLYAEIRGKKRRTTLKLFSDIPQMNSGAARMVADGELRHNRPAQCFRRSSRTKRCPIWPSGHFSRRPGTLLPRDGASAPPVVTLTEKRSYKVI